MFKITPWKGLLARNSVSQKLFLMVWSRILMLILEPSYITKLILKGTTDQITVLER